jgi:hypothetical protein
MFALFEHSIKTVILTKLNILHNNWEDYLTGNNTTSIINTTVFKKVFFYLSYRMVIVRCAVRL